MKAKSADDSSGTGADEVQRLAEQARHQTLFEHAPEGILIADADSRYLDANPGMCRMLGYARDELIGMHASDIVAPSEIQHVAPALNEIKTGSGYSREWQFRRKDGSMFSAEVTATTMPDGNLLAIVRDISARKQAEMAAAWLAAIVESSGDAIIGKDLNGIITSWNSGAENIFGYSARDMIGTSMLRLIPADRQHEETMILGKIGRGEKMEYLETLRLTRDKRLVEVSVAVAPIRDGAGNIIGASKIARDITALKAREREVARITRLYAALSQINQAIVRIESRDELFEKICRALVEHGGFRMAWIGWRDPATHQLEPVAVCGDETGYIQNIKVYVDDRPEGRGPSGTSFRTGRPYICNDMLADPATLPWRTEIERRGFRASAVFPVRQKGQVSGTLTVYADQQDFFQDKEIKLLEEAAGDISFALDNLVREAQRRLAEITAQSEKQFSDTMIESMPGIVYFYNDQGRFLRWNRNFETASGYSGAEIARMHPLDMFSGEERHMLELRIAEVFESGESFIEASLIAKDGKATPYYFTGRRVEFNGMPCLVGMGIDISERRAIEDQINFKNRILQTQQETSLDAILVVGENGEVLTFNRKFIELWRFPAQIIDTHVDALVLPFAAGQTEDPEAFIAKVRYLYAHRDQASNDELQLKDGRVVDRYSAPITGEDGKYYGRIWYFRDVTERKQALAELQQSESWFRSIFENVNTGIASTDSSGKITSFNEAFSTMLGYDAEALKAMHIADFSHPDDFKQQVVFLDEILAGKRNHYHLTKRYIANHGRILWVDVSASVIRDADGNPANLVAVIQDITERKEAEARIVYLNRVYAMLSGINTLIVRVSGRDELYKEACRIAVEVGGFRMAMLCTVDPGTKRIVPFTSMGKDEEIMAAVKGILSSSEGIPTTMVARAIREKRVIVSNDMQNDPQVLFARQYVESGVRSVAVSPLIVSDMAVGVLSLYAGETEFFHEEEMQLLAELTRDIAFAIDHIDKQEKLNYLAYYDPLTGLANHTLFHERVAQFMRSAAGAGHKLALLLIDLERFKNLSDSLGRPTGDALLKQVAEWLRQNMGGEELLARLDADHFAVVVPKVTQDGDLTKLFDKMSKTFLEHPFHLNDTVFRIAAKAGIALFPDDGSDVDTLFNNAEAALKMAKKSGDRYLFHTRRMTEAVAGKLTLENQLRRAIDNEEFVLHYQPKVNLVSGKVTGAEALIRWNDPRTGLVPPGRFIPILEETGLVYDVGRWALRQAISDYLRWRAAGLVVVRIAVNVSPLQLRNPGFVAEIEKKIGVDAHAAGGLELEITESMIMEDMRRNVMSLQAIRAMGVTVAIDDFGTGFSSLGYLAKLPADTLKIDRSFVVDMTAGPEGLALVSTIIDLGHALKFKVVAEGVETEEQSRLLRLLNCDEMQGYLFSKAVPADDFETRFLAP